MHYACDYVKYTPIITHLCTPVAFKFKILNRYSEIIQTSMNNLCQAVDHCATMSRYHIIIIISSPK